MKKTNLPLFREFFYEGLLFGFVCTVVFSLGVIWGEKFGFSILTLIEIIKISILIPVSMGFLGASLDLINTIGEEIISRRKKKLKKRRR